MGKSCPDNEKALRRERRRASVEKQSGREDLNFRPHGPEPCALAKLSYAPLNLSALMLTGSVVLSTAIQYDDSRPRASLPPSKPSLRDRSWIAPSSPAPSCSASRRPLAPRRRFAFATR